ncbi:MAG: hypothetical protein Q9168_005934, partial [Polycauliona sp. 1 TL-2023]
MGHSEPTSGIAGIMKAVLAIEHGIIPPTVGLKTLNPNIDLKDGRIKIVTDSVSWPDMPIRRASINSFGYGGANAHAIIESVDSVLPNYRSRRQAGIAHGISSRPASDNDPKHTLTNGYTNGHTNDLSNGMSNGLSDRRPDGHVKDHVNGYANGSTNGHSDDYAVTPGQERKHFLLPLSAHDEKTLQRNFATLRDTVANWDLVDVAYTLGERRSMLAHRAFVVAEAGKTSQAFAVDKLPVAKRQGTTCPAVCFVFTGQGAQWPQMGQGLMHEFPQYLKTIRSLDLYLDELQDGRTWSIEGALQRRPEESSIHDAEMSQPLVTALQIALVNLLASWSIRPAGVVGHSSGEIAAAYAAGLVTEQEAIITAYLRGKAVSKNTQLGEMMAVGTDAVETKPEVATGKGPAVIACYNSPESLTLSGDVVAVEEIKEALQRENKFARVLATGGNAYHSHHMKEIGQGYEDEMHETASRVPSRATSTTRKATADFPVTFYSSVYGAKVRSATLGPQYWRENLESPVLFHQAVSEMVTTMRPGQIVEIGPHSALKAPLRQIAKALSPEVQFPEYNSAIIRNSDNVADVLSLAGHFFTKGCCVDIGQVNKVEGADPKRPLLGKTITDLPHYQWQYPDKIILHENRYTKEWRLRMHPRHDILGSRIPGGVKTEPVWRNILRSKDLAWLGDHRIAKDIVFPATGYLAVALEAATQTMELNGYQASEIQSYEFQDVSLQSALIIPEDDMGVETLFSLRLAGLNNTTRHGSRYDFLLSSVVTEDEEDRFVDHCRGTVSVVLQSHDARPTPLIAEWEAASSSKKDISASQWYQSFAKVGLNYGPVFQGLSDIMTAGSSRLTKASIGLRPSTRVMSGESRYIIHPAALDAAMQLSILGAHSGSATKFGRAFMPVAFESIKVWPHVALITSESAKSITKGVLKGVRGLAADLVLVGDGEKPMFEVKNALFIASDQNVQIFKEKSGPYARMVWKPEFNALDDGAVAQLYPPIALDDSAVIPSLNDLALHQLIQFRATNSHIFKLGSQVYHLQRLLDWTSRKLSLAEEGPSSPAKEILQYSNEYRAEEITRLSELLNPRCSESRLMCHLYNNLPAIYSGEKTGIQVALQDNLLLETYDGQATREGNKRLGSILDVLSHQKPDLKILEVGGGTGSLTRVVLPALQGHTHWRKYSEYRFTDITTSFLAGAEEKFAQYEGVTFGAFDMEKPAKDQGYEPEWDLVIASNVVHATSDIKGTLQNIRSTLKPGGKMILLETIQLQLSVGLLLGTFSDFWKGDHDQNFPRLDGPFLDVDLWRSVLPQAGFSGLDFYLDDYAGTNRLTSVICASAVDDSVSASVSTSLPTESYGINLVYRGTPGVFILAFEEHLKSTGANVDMVTLEDVDNVQYDRFLFLVELEKPLFLDITSAEWSGLQTSLKCARSALWVTNGSLMTGREPQYAIISGLARGLKTENNRLRFSCLDLDQLPAPSGMHLLSRFEQRIADASVKDDDAEFRWKEGIIYISRVAADDTLNEQSRAKADQQISTQETPLRDLRSTPFQMAIDKPGVLSTIYFKPDHRFDRPLASDEVEIEVAAAGINNKDIAVVTGRHHSDTFSDECAGTIAKVGASVQDFKPGDRVYFQSFAKFGNFVRDKASFCQKMQAEDTFEAAATMPLAFCTAIYGLINLGRLSRGETVLIQSATGAVGLAAMQLARMCGAEIYATVGSTEKKKELLKMGYGVSEDHIFDSRDTFSAQALMDQTDGRGIDVILCSAKGQMMHDFWKCIANCGRFVEIGRTEVLENGKLQLDVFKRNATFTSFDLEVMSTTRPDIIASLMSTLDRLKREGVIKSLTYSKFHVSEVDNAMATFGKATHIGKLVLSYNHDTELGVKFRQSPFNIKFDPEASYLLVGCLGGLGRSFSNWMVQRGARHLIYLSRTGANKPEAQLSLEDLRAHGVDAKVQIGDVLNLQDVKDAVAASDRPVKGVIQGALVLNDGLFESMTLEKFHSTVKPRVIGTLNLHTALQDSPLDFFQMWSSWTTMFGPATQSNYLASNAFMDAFARHRHAQNLPASSIGLSQILEIGVASSMP